MNRKSFAILALVATISLPAHAALPSAPSRKPPVVFTSKVVSTQDAATVRAALVAADRGQWSEVARLETVARDPVATDLVAWLRATRDPGASFDQLNAALNRFSSWPRLSTIRAKAEDAISMSALSHRARVDWFGDKPPMTGEGKVSLAVSYLQIGDRDRASSLIREAWRSNALTPSRTREILRDHRAFLTQEDHRARADYLVWSRQLSDALAMKPYLTGGWSELVEARVSLARRQRNVDGKINAVPANLQDNPGLLFERAVWRRKAGLSDSSVNEVLIAVDGTQIPASGRSRLWDERAIAARGSIRDGDFATAYNMSTSLGLSSGVDFAESEFLAGWLAFRKRNDPARGLEHFRNLETGVSSPISVSRAQYWQGRTLETLGDRTSADAAFNAASVFPFTYYGQLSSEKVGKLQLDLPTPIVATTDDRAAFEARPLIRAVRLLGEAGEQSLFREFVLFVDGTLTTDLDHELLFQVTADYNLQHIGLRGAKTGLSNGVIAPDAAYPLLTLQPLKRANVEDALVLALSRQESEFYQRAVSSADARGLMQLLPSTARRQAALEGLPFRTSWLTDDPAYNVTLGSAHLEDLIRQFNGSYILPLTAYNAGASRSRRWINDYGDPRSRTVDVIDWIETIPFGETRNYVQRIMENLQVYRARLSSAPTEITLSRDLRRGDPD